MEPMPVPEWEDPEVRAEVPAREPDAAREEPVPAAPREERLSTAMPSLAPREELKGALTKTADSALPGEHSDAEPQEPAELQPQEPQEPQEFQEPEAVAEARASPGKADARGRSGKGKAKSKPGHRQKSVDAARGTQSAMAAEEPVLVPPAPGVRFSPSVIGKHEVLLDVDEKAGEFPQYHRMPPSLPFHFRLDVSALKFSANGLAKAKWLQKLREELEKNWRYSRKDQERAWVREGELPGEVRDILERNGKCSEQVMAAVQRRRADPSWQEENDQGQMEKTMPMHVLRLERLARRGEELTQEDAKEITEEGLWCNMIYDLSTDPLLQDIGYAGQNPTQFSAMVLIYTRHLDKLDLKKDLTQELRVAHVDHFEYGLCFPIRPYPSCQLPPPPDREDLSWIFEREGRTADGAELERLVKQGDAMMTTLFWQCFDAFFHADYKRQSTTKPAFSRTQLFAKPTAKDLTACGTRQEALLALLSILRAQAFQFPFCQKVTFVEAVEHRKSQKSFPGAGHCDVLAAAEVAVQRALREYTAAMQDGNQEMPQWAERPIRLRERDFATAATPPGNSEEQSPVPLLVQLPQPGMAMLHCVGLSPLKKEELEEKDNECDSGSESSKQNEEEPGAENEEEVEAQLQADDIIDSGGLLHLHSRMSESHLTRGFMYPWRSKGLWDYYVVKRCRCDIDLVLRHYGPKIASYFDFLETYSSFLLIASVLGVCAEIAGPPNGYSDGFGKSIQPGFGVCISMWGTFFCILWRRRAAWLAHNWQNGWVEEGEDIGGAGAVTTMSRVRPEFALQWRKNFDNASQDDQQQTYHMLRGLLKIPHADDPHFDDRALKTDIMHFDEACYLSDWLQIWRSLVSYLASGVFILFATTATFGALAARQALGLEGTTAGYAVTGLTSSVLVPLLNVVHYQVVIYTNNYQLFRDDSAKEKDFFDRLFIFNLFNTYNSLLWIVFAERNMAQLRVQVLFLCLSSIFMNNFIEFYWSLWMKQLKKMKSNSLPVASNMWTTLRYLLTGELHDDGVPEPMDPVSTALEHVSEELSRDLPFEVVDEAIELVIQYGVIMMFTVAFPMAPLLAFINVHIEKRLDSLKIVKLMQFPEPRMVVGMGRPFAAFVIVTGLGLLVSGLTLYFAAYEGRDCERCDTWGSCSGCAGTSVQLLLPEATTELRLFLLGGGGTVMLLVMYICFSSPPLSIKIVHEQYRQKMYENRLRFRRETGDAHGRLSRRVSVKGPASPQGMPE
ncbi:unnamed protein product [Effrenium voratum]|uniref:Anoctamin transmembrane domain-containing protein n=1 Tax=Effrenium voratum TaxID=2562239 RepID=A0AA36I4I1_9DINO|nr:unnamed protein product [Effrenium voratum]